jgi:hypothetical protein
MEERYFLSSVISTPDQDQPMSYTTGTGFLAPELKRQELEAYNPPNLVIKSRKVDLYLHVPSGLHGIVLSQLGRQKLPSVILLKVVIECY